MQQPYMKWTRNHLDTQFASGEDIIQTLNYANMFSKLQENYHIKKLKTALLGTQRLTTKVKIRNKVF